MLKLSELKIGQKAVVQHFLQEEVFLKVLEMGLLPQSLIEIVSKAPLGDPVNIRLQDTMLSLRKSEAENIVVKIIQI